MVFFSKHNDILMLHQACTELCSMFDFRVDTVYLVNCDTLSCVSFERSHSSSLPR